MTKVDGPGPGAEARREPSGPHGAGGAGREPDPAIPPGARRLIELLGLAPHPQEGGWFRETYRSADNVPTAAGVEAPGPSGTGPTRGRPLSTAIYYLLTPDSCSGLHRLPGDEVFHFYLGDPVEMLMLHADGRSERVVLGPDPAVMRVQHVVPGGTWQGSRLAEGGRWALLGTTMAPGFDPTDYEAGTEALLAAFPAEEATIRRLLPRGSLP